MTYEELLFKKKNAWPSNMKPLQVSHTLWIVSVVIAAIDWNCNNNSITWESS